VEPQYLIQEEKNTWFYFREL